MKLRNIAGFGAGSLLGLALMLGGGCASEPRTSDMGVHLGMSRDDLRFFFGEPVRVEPDGAGGESWYYRFVTWKARPGGESGSSVENGERTSYAAVTVEFSQDPEEAPIHLSPEGHVIEPLPKGKVVKD
jgi:hypothetical protein